MPRKPLSTRATTLRGLDPSALVRLGMAASARECPPAVPGYEIHESLGSGGMGEVFRARQISLGREVAVKILRSDCPAAGWLPERFEQEAKTMAALHHPNVVTVHDCVRLDDDRVVIVMELIGGGSLRRNLESAPDGLPLARALKWAREIAEGLRAAHGAGVVHRDVKPDNVLIDETGAARVSDFGVAFSQLSDALRFTQTGMTAGTPGYMAPELWRGAEAEIRSDIFSFGVTFYEMLTGRLPQGNFPPVKKLRPETPDYVDRVILGAMRPDPAGRPADMSAVLRALNVKPGLVTRRRVLGASAATAAAVGAAAWWMQRKNVPGVPGNNWSTIEWPENPQASAVSGGWRVENGLLYSDDRICILPITRELPPACKLRLRLTRLSGINSLGVFFRNSAGTAVCTLDGRGYHFGGVQSVNGEVLNPSNSFKSVVENGRSYDWTIQLRPRIVRMWVDGSLQDERDISGAELSVPDTWAWKPKPGSPQLHIGSWKSPTQWEWFEWLAEEESDGAPVVIQ